jgi:sodium-dependent dicarboxylate transporter 2/3/5
MITETLGRERPTTAVVRSAQAIRQKIAALLPTPAIFGVVLGPLVGLVVWGLPLGLDPGPHKALAIVALMLVYWILEPIDYGVTALIGCYLFWALQVTKFSVAFSGFANATPWYILGVLLLGEATSWTGLAKRLGYLVVRRTGTSYSRLLLGIIMLIWLMSFLIPSPTALVTTLAPVALGILAVLGAERIGNLAKGLFVILTYVATVFGKMILGGGVTVLARGIIETQTGLQVLWSQWLLAFLPCALLTIVAAWLTVRWLYPVESDVLPGGRQSLRETIQAMRPWSAEEQKTLAALLLAIGLWATDFLHQLNRPLSPSASACS